MKGFVDDKLRALLRVPVSASSDGERREIEVWIDTAFGSTPERLCYLSRLGCEETDLPKTNPEDVLGDGSAARRAAPRLPRSPLTIAVLVPHG